MALMRRVDGRNRSTGQHTGISQHRAPGINHHGVTMAVSTSVMQSSLCRRQHVGGVLDGTGLKQHLPMVLSGEGGEGGWNHQQISAGTDEMSVELRKADVVADGQSHLAETRHIDHGGQTAGFTVADSR